MHNDGEGKAVDGVVMPEADRVSRTPVKRKASEVTHGHCPMRTCSMQSQDFRAKHETILTTRKKSC